MAHLAVKCNLNRSEQISYFTNWLFERVRDDAFVSSVSSRLSSPALCQICWLLFICFLFLSLVRAGLSEAACCLGTVEGFQSSFTLSFHLPILLLFFSFVFLLAFLLRPQLHFWLLRILMQR